ncbi:MAG: phosphoglycerate dehydrogenase [Candidatus Omnitrophica bacterium]|nr:phosphoglycerate dehydrogenase [Candidatus Omnitrophota bacterium]
MKVLVSDKLGEKGLAVLKKEKKITCDVKTGMKPDELKEVIKGYDGIVIRSSTKLTKDILEGANNLKVIGRAGVGVDNVDLETASKKGIIVMNTPGGNTVSTCEHTIAMIMALSRNIPQADASLRKKEWKRSQFLGTEVYGKTLGIVGFGRIGKEVAKRMLSFGMKIIVYDPFISPDTSPQLEVEVVDINELCKRSDYITVHTPKTAETKYLFKKETFALMKDSVRIINCARGGIVSEADLYEAIKSGKVKGAALDVFETEPPYESPLLSLDQVIVVPHLGASTEEAQENVGIAVAEQVVDALLGRGIKNAVNLPSFDPDTMNVLRPWVHLSERLGTFVTQFSGGEGLKRISIKYSGEVTNFQLSALTLSVIKGVLAPMLEDNEINYVNAPIIAKERGIEVIESKSSQLGDFSNAIAIEIQTGIKVTTVVGTLFGNNSPRIVRINDYHIDAVLEGVMLCIHNQDIPGMVGEIGTMLGTSNVNIAEMSLGRKKEGDVAITIINTDQVIPNEILEKIKKLKNIVGAIVVSFS